MKEPTIKGNLKNPSYKTENAVTLIHSTRLTYMAHVVIMIYHHQPTHVIKPEIGRDFSCWICQMDLPVNLYFFITMTII